MGDQAHDFAERKIAEFQAEVRETYQQAQADAQEALSRFLERFEKEDERQREKVKAGELSEADYKAWRKGKILRSRQLSSTLDQVSRAMAEANQVAVAALRGRLPEVYAENANYAAFQTCEASGLDLAFSLVDAPTVQHMLTAGEALFSVPALDVAKDVAWNRRLMASQLTQGVLLGESIPKMARRVQRVTGSNIATATRTARTAVTGAECAGRVSSYERAREMGIKLKQEWVAALDNRTRHSHRKLDGTKVEVGGTFPNGCRFPGDPTARYAEICNCRCTLVAAVEGFETDDAKRASKLPKGMTYEEWKAGHAERKPHDSSGRTMGEFLGQPIVKAQLDKRGMSENQARKVLSEHLKAQGISGNSFRSMQKASQQAQWNAAIAGFGMAPLGGSLPSGLAGTKETEQMARGMAKALRKCDDKGVKALFEKYGKSLRVKDEAGHIAWYNPLTRRVEMEVAKASKGTKWHKPYQVVFHEFGHMIDYEAGGGLPVSLRSGIVKAIDDDWRKMQVKALADLHIESGRGNPRWLFSDLVYFAKDTGNDSVLKLARRARSAYKVEGKPFDEIIRSGAFKRAVEDMCDWMLADGKGYDGSLATRRILDGLEEAGAKLDFAKYGDALDIIQGATGITRPLGFGHGAGYFDGEDGEENRATEFFAEVCSAKAVNKESLEVINRMFPSAVREFEKLIGGL